MKAQVVHEPTGNILFIGASVKQCEDWIAEREKTDPQGVHAGDYGIDADEEAMDAYYTRLTRGR